jgi:thioredoxin 1
MYKKQSHLENVNRENFRDTHEFVISIDSYSSMIDFVKRNELVVVDVFADWCGPCRSLAPRYEALAGKYINQAIFLKINLDDIDDADMKAEITALPTFFIFRNDGQRITKQKESGISVAQLESFIN